MDVFGEHIDIYFHFLVFCTCNLYIHIYICFLRKEMLFSWSVLRKSEQLLTHTHFTSPSLSDFNPSGALECLWVLKKAEKTLEPQERKVKPLLTEGHCRKWPEIKRKLETVSLLKKVAREILKNQKVLVTAVCVCPRAPERIYIQMLVGKLM